MKRILLLFVLLALCRFASGQNEPQAMFLQSHYQSCTAPFSVTFKDTSWSPVRSSLVFWRWEFGDGTVDSSGPIVAHTYAQKGMFRVKLTVRDQAGRQGVYTGNDNQLIRIGAALQMPPRIYLCNEPQPVLRNLATPEYFDSLGTYRWVRYTIPISTERTVLANQAGAYELYYTACDTVLYGLTSVVDSTVEITPSGPSVWLNDTVKHTFWVQYSLYGFSKMDQISWLWEDGSITVTKGFATSDHTVRHNYTVPGTYNVRANVRLTNPAEMVCDTSATYTFTIRQPYVTHNSWNKKDTSYRGSPLTLSAGNTGATFKWGSSDPSFTASTQTVTLTKAGKYWVEIKKSGDVITDTINFTPIYDFSIELLPCDRTLSVKFTPNVTVPLGDSLLSITWYYGDGKSDTYNNNPYWHSYFVSGTYMATMEVRLKSGFSKTVSKSLTTIPYIEQKLEIRDDTVSMPGVHVLSLINVLSSNARIRWYPGPGRGDVIKSGNDTIQARVPGWYFASRIDSCAWDGDTIEVRDPFTSEWNASVGFKYTSPCYDTAWVYVKTNAPKGTYQVLWNTGSTSDSLLVYKPKQYGFIFTDIIGKKRKDSAYINVIPLDSATLDVRIKNGHDTLVAGPYHSLSSYYFYRNDTLLTTTEYNYNNLYAKPIPGVYKVRIRNLRGCQVTSLPLYYSASNDSTTINFSYAAEKCLDQRIIFTGSAVAFDNVDTVRSIKWNFGDGKTATYPGGENTVTHNYEALGTYTVSFTATTAAGRTFSTSKQVVILHIINYSVSISSDTTRLQNTIVLRAIKNPYNGSVTWSTGSTNDTIHVHADGYYSVWLKDNCGNVRATDSLRVKNGSIYSIKATIVAWSPCGDTAWVLAGNRVGPPISSISWSTGEQEMAIYVSKSGIYVAMLKDYMGNVVAEDSIYVDIKPFKPSLQVHNSATPGNDTLIAYTLKSWSNDYSYKWYRDGIEVTSGNVPMLHNPVAGSYTVFVQSKTGCSAFSDTVYFRPAISWTLEAQIGNVSKCGDSALLVTAVTAPDSNYIVSWNTGEQSPSIYVTTSGNYIATLRDRQGNVQAVDSVAVDLKPFKARIELHGSATPGNDTLIVYPNNVSDTGNYYRWYRDGVQVSFGPSPMLHNPIPGLYIVYAFNKAGCIATTDTVRCVAGPALSVGFDYIVSPCDAQWVRFIGSANTRDSKVTYKWNFGDGSEMINPNQFGWNRYAAAGTYNIKLKVTTSSGLTDSITKQVVVHADQEVWNANIIKQGNQCGDTVWLNASSTNVKAGSFTWSTGEEMTTIAVTKSGSYSVDVLDSCYNVRASDTIEVIINAPCLPNLPGDTIDIGNGPIEGGKALPVTAGFDHGFNADNVFTVQLTLRNPGGRETGIQPDEVINLGTTPGTNKDIAMQVNIPDSLACATSYAVRVVASSPADTTAWSQLFTITNQPAQPVITQRGDSLFTSGKYNWQWYFNDKAIEGATSTSYRARANGSYTVESLNGNDCKSKSSPVSVIITAVGEVTLGSNKVKAFPNPSEGQVSLQFEKPLLKAVTIKVYNMNGRVMYTRTTTQQLQPLDLSGLPKGYYLIELTGYGQQKVLSLILQ